MGTCGFWRVRWRPRAFVGGVVRSTDVNHLLSVYGGLATRVQNTRAFPVLIPEKTRKHEAPLASSRKHVYTGHPFKGKRWGVRMPLEQRVCKTVLSRPSCLNSRQIRDPGAWSSRGGEVIQGGRQADRHASEGQDPAGSARVLSRVSGNPGTHCQVGVVSPDTTRWW